MIDDIIEEQARQGEMDAETAATLGYSGRSRSGGVQNQQQAMGGRRYQAVQVPNDLGFWLEVAKAALLFLILVKL